MTEKKNVQFGLPPVCTPESRVLILGSFPSVLSRGSFYYGNPRNRFWDVVGFEVGEPAPEGIEPRREWLMRHGIALWDLVGRCTISGSSDADLKSGDCVINDIGTLVARLKSPRVFCNGAKSYELLKKSFPEIACGAVQLPSTSPANVSFYREAWHSVGAALKEERFV